MITKASLTYQNENEEECEHLGECVVCGLGFEIKNKEDENLFCGDCALDYDYPRLEKC